MRLVDHAICCLNQLALATTLNSVTILPLKGSLTYVGKGAPSPKARMAATRITQRLVVSSL